MIKIESVQIKELRGIRDLTLAMNRGSFVISGQNGSGKSGVVDAIQFALTGEIGRLKGAGTGDLTLSDHGPHVEARSYPDASSVCLNVYIPHLNKSASITRKISKPKQVVITPNEASVKAVFEELAQHPELTLARREIIRFILAEAAKRSQDVQTLLKLEDIDQARATLKTTENKLNTAYSTAKSQADVAGDSLKRHLDLPKLMVEDLLATVNKRRKILDLPDIKTLEKDTSVSHGISEIAATVDTAQTKESTLRDIKAIADAVAGGLETSTASTVTLILRNIDETANDPYLLPLLKRLSLFQSGLDLIDSPSCPLCDKTWDIESLRRHLQGKIEKSKKAQVIQNETLESGRLISTEAIKLRGLIEALTKIKEVDEEFTKQLREWSARLLSLSESLSSMEGIVALKEHFKSGWISEPSNMSSSLEALRERVQARPDKSAAGEARDFLVIAQERLGSWRTAKRDAEARRVAAERGKTAHKTYCDVAESALTGLYAEVEADFGEYYQLINHDDEGEFRAQFQPSSGKLGLLVDFHKKGMFPPGAFHSEGHQDGMGICLYLALMRHVLGDRFMFAVLDDVVMSVDSQHRKQFCKLLKIKFPDTQFVITTHDQVWARQMRTEGLIGAKSAVAFHTWTVDTGPVIDEVAEIWDQISNDLNKNEVPTAAARLRRHLEYVAADLADELGAKVSFKGDGGYDMGELLSAVIGRQGVLLKKAEKAANSWDDADAIATVGAIQKKRAEILSTYGDEQWVVNKAIHYNEWANLSRQDFEPVVNAFKELLQQFRCEKPKCDSWLTLTPKNDPTDLRCDCGSFRLNLKQR